MVEIHLSYKDFLARKLTFFFFLKENLRCGYTHLKRLGDTLLMITQNVGFLREIKKKYLTSWILFLARVMQSLSQDKYR